MKLYFLRHGIAGERTEWKGEDADRPLTGKGIQRMEEIAATMAQWGLKPDAILSSP
jgi:8-oxo-(d)GTP phosphatase